ncbi:response regulator transcription factor [Draconibacterium sp. IB214405]|uniref:response regulator transcription factor n=1 Tax=Draconibacterium sp. IB214405 TaxID=3097352 RepID=UPI002A1699B0|nr:response regulator transcription factor [Draconibacterium sp. IB214405]MDX8340913.1 response regulator transcription factor [Draconibacterium sp. IB214405]
MTENKIDIVVTDDHMLFRKGMAALLEDFEMVENIYEAGNGVQLLRLLEGLDKHPDLILLDINMPEMDGVEVAGFLRRDYPDIRILILSMEDAPQLVTHLINEGVNGYLLKSADPEELELAVKKVIKNDFYFSGSLSGAVLQGMKSTGSHDLVKKLKLTKRELEVLKLLCEELTATEIGDRLGLSARTVEGHKYNLLDKTETKNIAGLVIFAIKNNLYTI